MKNWKLSCSFFQKKIQFTFQFNHIELPCNSNLIKRNYELQYNRVTLIVIAIVRELISQWQSNKFEWSNKVIKWRIRNQFNCDPCATLICSFLRECSTCVNIRARIRVHTNFPDDDFNAIEFARFRRNETKR